MAVKTTDSGSMNPLHTRLRPLAESFFQWGKNPAACETARARLAALILTAASSGNAAPVKATSSTGN